MGTLRVNWGERSAAIGSHVREHGVRLNVHTLAPETNLAELAAFEQAICAAQVLVLGELNHFIHEKVDFRLWWLRRIASRRRLVLGEELGWSDGYRVDCFLRTGDVGHLDRVATFAYEGDRRRDRDDTPTGILDYSRFPQASFMAEQRRFYAGLRALPAVPRYFGFDIDTFAGAGYADVAALLREHEQQLPLAIARALQPVQGESIAAEADRLQGVLTLLRDAWPAAARVARRGVSDHVAAMIASLRYVALVNPAPDYEAMRPGLAVRERHMQARVDAVVDSLADDELLVLMAHAFHLAKDDAGIATLGVGPGGGQLHSLGHHLVQECGLRTASVWMVYGAGSDNQPLADLPNDVHFPAQSLNAVLAELGGPLILPLLAPVAACLAAPIAVGHLYNMAPAVHLPAEVDAVFFVPRVSPLRA